MLLKRSLSRDAFRTGMILALASILASAAAVMLTWRLMNRENRAYVQQSIGDTTELLALHVREEFQRLGDHLAELGESSLKPELLKREMAQKAATLPQPPVNPEEVAAGSAPVPPAQATPPQAPSAKTAGAEDGWLNASPEILDLALWSRPGEGGTAVPRLLMLNSLYPEPKPDWASRLRAQQDAERSRIDPAFKGHTVVVSDEGMAVEGKPLALIAVPLGHGAVSEVVVAHIRIDRLRKDFQRDGMIRTMLVDGEGAVLAQDDAARLSTGGSVASGPLFQNLRSSELSSAQQGFSDTQGIRYFGGFRKIGIGDLAILASIPESEATSGLHDLRNQSVLFLALNFVVYLGVGYAFRKRRAALPAASLSAAAAPDGATGQLSAKGALGEAPQAEEPPQRKLVIALHGSLRRLTQLIEAVNPDDATEAINDFLEIAASRARAHGGRFERYAGASFVAVWCSPHFEGNEAWRALQCAVDLCQDLVKLNESRKVDGHRSLSFGMGVHTGVALGTRVGSGAAAREAFFGEVITCARSLDHLASSTGSGVLVSQEVWDQCGDRFIGERLGEAKLTPETGLTAYIAARGFRDGEGKETLLPAFTVPEEPLPEGTRPHIVLPEKKQNRWLVNNGSQIVGPFSPKEVAGLLFAQELDFDCECWVDGTGQSAQIKDAGIFSGSNDAEASLWVFDGEIVHGPVSQGFLNTAVSCGAIREDCFVCEGSTIAGWLALAEWRRARGPGAPASAAPAGDPVSAAPETQAPQAAAAPGAAIAGSAKEGSGQKVA